MPARVTLCVTQGALKGHVLSFEERATCLIGKAEDCQLRLPRDDDHATISRHHCLFDINPLRVRLRDFGSRNGTYVNGVKIGQRGGVSRAGATVGLDETPDVDLKHGDEVTLGRVGRVKLKVEVQAPPACATCGAEIETSRELREALQGVL